MLTSRGWGSSRCRVSGAARHYALEKTEAYLSLATSQGDVNETAGVCETLLRTTLGGLLLLLLLDLFICESATFTPRGRVRSRLFKSAAAAVSRKSQCRRRFMNVGVVFCQNCQNPSGGEIHRLPPQFEAHHHHISKPSISRRWSRRRVGNRRHSSTRVDERCSWQCSSYLGSLRLNLAAREVQSAFARMCHHQDKRDLPSTGERSVNFAHLDDF
jgi:hypothetical protein